MTNNAYISSHDLHLGPAAVSAPHLGLYDVYYI